MCGVCVICINWTVPFCFLFAFNTVFPGSLHLATLGLLLPAALGCGHVFVSITMLYLNALPVMDPHPSCVQFPTLHLALQQACPSVCLWVLCMRPSLGYLPRSGALGQGCTYVDSSKRSPLASTMAILVHMPTSRTCQFLCSHLLSKS